MAILQDDIEEFKSKSGNENIQSRRKQAEKAIINEMFLNEELESDKESEEEFEEEADEESDEKSDEESDEKSNEKSDEESNENFDNKSDEKFEDKSGQNNQARVSLIATCSIIHAREKLVRIVNGEVVVSKQW